MQEQLHELSQSDDYPFHMPGHKRNNLTGAHLPYDYDITEIDGFDDLHHATGKIREIEQKASRLYGCADTALLINGSTAGILSAILACTKHNGVILIARNCHRSVYHAIELQKLTAIYVYPREDERIHAQDVQSLLEQHPEIEAVVITSPTYEGYISHIATISEIVHHYDIPLIVDEAHGSHLDLQYNGKSAEEVDDSSVDDRGCPDTSLRNRIMGVDKQHNSYKLKAALHLGADIVIHSLHKTLPSLTQTALIHTSNRAISKGYWKQVRHYLQIFQSSSPSYLLIMSIEACLDYVWSCGENTFVTYWKRVDELRRSLSKLQVLQLIPIECGEDYDEGKLIISTKNSRLTGRNLYDLLRTRFHLQLELAGECHVLAMTSIADTKQGFDRLVEALNRVDEELLQAQECVNQSANLQVEGSLHNQQAIGRCSKNYVYVYPPGTPIIAPGEIITQEMVRIIERYQSNGLMVHGLREDGRIDTIPVPSIE